MKNQIITGIAIVACVAFCSAVWPRSVVVAEPIKPAVIGEIGARSAKTQPILLSADTHISKWEAEAVSKPEKTDTTTEEKTQKTEPTKGT